MTLLMSINEAKFLKKYLILVPDSDNKLFKAVKPDSIPSKDKKRLLAFDESYFDICGYHSIVNYSDLK